MQAATPSSKHPLGGISRDWRRRLLRFHIPIALVSTLALVLFMTLPRFDASAYPGLDMHSSGWFPQSRGAGGSMDMDMDMDMNHDENEADGGDDSDHGGGQAGSMGDDQNNSQGEHGGDQSEPIDSDDEHDGDETERTEGGH